MFATIVISVLIAAVICLIIWHLIRKKKQGKSSCGCGCADCAMSQMCHKQE